MAANDGDLPVLASINSPVKSILKDLLTTAKRRKSGSYAVLYEAYSSLKACPIQFTSIRQLLSLGGFGPALVDKIQMLLCQWCEDNGKRYVEAQSSRAAARQANIESDGEGELEDAETDSDLDRRAPRKQTKKKAKEAAPTKSTIRKAAEKEPKVFVPQHRTGTHGILVSLFTLTPDMPEEDVAGLEAAVGMHDYSKATVIQFAQPYSNSSYIPKETSAPGSGYGNYHCAWSGMKTLINRAYVYRRGNPARFGLSRQGWKVAQTCAEREKGLSAGCNENKVGDMADGTPEPSKRRKKSASSKQIGETLTPKEGGGPFLYTYLTGDRPPQQTKLRKDASIRLSDRDYRMLYKITFSKDLAEHTFTKSCIEDATEEGGLLCGWVKEAVCNEVAPGIPSNSISTVGSSRRNPASNTKENIEPPLLKHVSGQQDIVNTCRGALQTHISNSQGTVIELLTSSDVEFEPIPRPVKSKSKPVRRREDHTSESELSDMAPLVKQKKASKVRR